MMRDADMKIRLDEQLKDEFMSACSSLDITASQRIRQMMSQWVSECQEEGVIAKPKKREWSKKLYERLGV